jgi:prephenate dehydratase
VPSRKSATGVARIAYFGPEGTFTHEALIDALRGSGSPAGRNEASFPAGIDSELVPFDTIYETVMAVQTGEVGCALVPIENSLEGSVNATLDTLAAEAEAVRIVGELVHPIRHCLVARKRLGLEEIKAVVSHPQATAQCARFLRTQLPGVRVLAGSSTADAVRMVAAHEEAWAALGTEFAAARYGCQVLLAGVEDGPVNETRFVWLARGDDARSDVQANAWKTSIVFWGVGSDAPGWLVRCLSEFSDRKVNLTRIESRPRRQGLGSNKYFLDLEGREDEPQVSAALGALDQRVEMLRLLGSYPAG